MGVVDVRLPEGVRLLSVYLSSDEYEDLMTTQQHCRLSSYSGNTVVQSQRLGMDSRDADNTGDVEADCLTVASSTVLNCSGSVADAAVCKETDDDSFDNPVNETSLATSNTEGRPLIQQQAQQTVALDANAGPSLSAISDDMRSEAYHRSCNDQTPSEVNNDTGGTIAWSTSLADIDAVNAGNAKTRLVPLELYIQGNSQTVFLLFMQQGSLSELDVVKDLVHMNALFCVSLVSCNQFFSFDKVFVLFLVKSVRYMQLQCLE